MDRTAVALAVTIIGIPLALANLKLIPVSLLPLGRILVPTDAAEATRYPRGALRDHVLSRSAEGLRSRMVWGRAGASCGTS